RSAPAATLFRNAHGKDVGQPADRNMQRQMLHGTRWRTHPRAACRRRIDRSLEVLPHVMLQGDRWIRARADVGWNRLPSLQDERVDRLQLGRTRFAFYPPTPGGLQPEEHLCRPRAPRLWPVFHGNRLPLHRGERDLSTEQKAICAGKRCNDMGLAESILDGPATL